ncbi:MAG: SCP2 sterol-binding domain-containing protein [Proteobacteria bacterium]|nr:SCP2 sterol-binding domain-containing protein [Pseudomonadota bacterium]
MHPYWNPSSNRFVSNRSETDLLQERRLYARRMEVVGMMAKAGVPLLAGSDTPNPYAFPGFGLHDDNLHAPNEKIDLDQFYGGIEAAATIRGSLLSLIDLLEGRVDGDALFFSRDLVIEGDTEAVLTLRNAIDGAGIDLVEIAASALGPFAGLARRVLGPAEALFRRATRDLERLQGALLFPVARRCDAQAAALDEIRTGMDDLRRRSRRPRAAPGAGVGAGVGAR